VAQLQRSFRLTTLLKLISGLYILLALAQSAWLPLFEGSDEQRHYAYARHLVNQHELPPLVKEPNDNAYNYLVGQMAGNPPLYYSLVALLTLGVPQADQNIDAYLRVNPFATAYDVQGIPFDNRVTYLHGSEGAFPWQGVALAAHLGRLASVLMGLGTLWAIASIVHSVIPEWPELAALAAVFALSLPQFLFVQSVMTPDSAVVLFTSLSLWIAMRILREGPSDALALWGGLFSALTILSKVNGAWVGLIVWVALVISHWLHASTRPAKNIRLVLLKRLLISVGLCVVVAGWWPVRGLLLRGDPFGVAIHSYDRNNPLSFDISPAAWAKLPQMLVDLEKSFWYAVGWSGFVTGPDWLYQIYRWLFGLGIVGAAAFFIYTLCQQPRRSLRSWLHSIRLWQFACLYCAIFFAGAGMVYWMLNYQWALGRLLLPALSGLIATIVLGWNFLIDTLRRFIAAISNSNTGALRPALIAGLTTAGLMGQATAMLNTYRSLNRHPDIAAVVPNTPGFTATYVQYLDPTTREPVATLVSYRLPRQNLSLGQVMFATLCWKSEGYTAGIYPYSFQIITEDNTRLGARDSFHGLGTFPMSAWRNNDTWCEPSSIKITQPVAQLAAYKILVSVFAMGDKTQPPKTLISVDANGREIFPVITSARVAPSTANIDQASSPPSIQFGQLVGLSRASAQLKDKTTLQLSLHWQAINQTETNYKVFAHLIDAHGNLIAQADSEPGQGKFPTQYWLSGDLIDDTITIPIPANADLTQAKVLLGLYDGQTQARLPATNTTDQSRFADDAVPIPIRD